MNEIELDHIKYADLNFHDLLEMNLSVDSLLVYLGVAILNPPIEQNLSSLLRKLATIDNADENGSLSKVEAWVQKEVAFGALHESEICNILRSTYPIPGASQSSIRWTVCPHIWKGIKSSRVLKVNDLRAFTLTCLLEAAARSPSFDEGFTMGSEIIRSRAVQDSKTVTSNVLEFLRLLMGNRHAVVEVEFSEKRFSGRLNAAVTLIDMLPKARANEAITYIVSTLIREKDKATNVNNHHKRLMWLQQWLYAFSQSHLLVEARKDSRLTSVWMNIEGRLSSLEPEFLAIYLYSFNDTEISSFLLEHLLVRWQLDYAKSFTVNAQSSAMPRLRQEALQLLTPPTPDTGSEVSPYINLIVHVCNEADHLLQRLLHYLLPLLRYLDKPEAVLSITDHLSRRQKNVPHTLLFSEISCHTDVNPVFALALLTADRRTQMVNCPSLLRALRRCNDVPILILLRLFRLLTQTYSVKRRRNYCTDLTPKASLILYQLADRIALSYALSPRQILRRVRRLFKLFMKKPELLSPQMASTLTAAGIVQPLRTGLKVAKMQQQWVGQWVVGLEGKDVWEGVEKNAESWWEEIEDRKRREGLVWKMGTGWVDIGKERMDGQAKRESSRSGKIGGGDGKGRSTVREEILYRGRRGQKMIRLV